jgi:hypothetical protein
MHMLPVCIGRYIYAYVESALKLRAGVQYSQVLRDVEKHGPRRGGARCPGGAAHVAGGGRDPARSPKGGLVRRQGLDRGWHEEDALLRRDALHQKHPRGIVI